MDCFTPDTQEHVIRCPSYKHLRTGKDLSYDKDLVQYFSNVLRLRDKLDEERNQKIWTQDLAISGARSEALTLFVSLCICNACVLQ